MCVCVCVCVCMKQKVGRVPAIESSSMFLQVSNSAVYVPRRTVPTNITVRGSVHALNLGMGGKELVL